jgi:hypothetical protein
MIFALPLAIASPSARSTRAAACSSRSPASASRRGFAAGREDDARRDLAKLDGPQEDAELGRRLAAARVKLK